MDTEQKKLWADDRKKHNLKYPSEDIIRFLKKNFETGSGKTIVDLGCGSGRNAMVMADMGFQIYAVDESEECLELTREKMEAVSYQQIEYIQNKDMEIPLPDESADCIVAWGVVMLVDKRQREALFGEIRRVLKPGGLFLADYRTQEDSMYGKGTEIERDMFCLGGVGQLDLFNYWFPKKEDLQSLYQENGLCIYNLETKEQNMNNLSVKNSYFHIWARKL